MKSRVPLYVALAAIVALLGLSTYMAFKMDDMDKKNKALIAQNVALTAQARADVSDAFKMGIITCTNEDVKFLNDTADEYSGTLFAKIIRNWAQTWAYDEDRLQELVNRYMDGEYN